MEKTKKSFYRIFILILVILAIFVGYFFYQNKLQPTKKSFIQQQNITVYLKLLNQTDFIKQDIAINKTALDLTKEKAKIVTKGEGVNAYVIEINGKLAEDSKKEFWAFYVNDKIAEVGAGSYKLKDGDKIECKIEKY
ncbi:MAG TPA: DUF4430 domain-containing protein [Patescibacteria group bacterium]